MKIENSQEGTCPKCGCSIRYYSKTCLAEHMEWEVRCSDQDCDWSGTEVHKFVFSHLETKEA